MNTNDSENWRGNVRALLDPGNSVMVSVATLLRSKLKLLEANSERLTLVHVDRNFNAILKENWLGVVKGDGRSGSRKARPNSRRGLRLRYKSEYGWTPCEIRRGAPR